MNGRQVAERSLTLRGSALAYRSWQGPLGDPLVLLHPWFGCPAFWDATVAGLPGRSCLVPDLYSLGDGDWEGLAGPRGIARAVFAMLDAENIDHCAIVGNSMGGIAAQIIAASQPGRIVKLVLVGTGASVVALAPDYRSAIDAWLDADANGRHSAAFVRRLLAREPNPDRMAVYVNAVLRANRKFMAATLIEGLKLDLRSCLRMITARTLILRGTLDAGRTRDHVRDLLRGIPDSVALEIPDAGHSPMVDSPELFVPLLRAFLDGAPVPGAGRELLAV